MRTIEALHQAAVLPPLLLQLLLQLSDAGPQNCCLLGLTTVSIDRVRCSDGATRQ